MLLSKFKKTLMLKMPHPSGCSIYFSCTSVYEITLSAPHKKQYLRVFREHFMILKGKTLLIFNPDLKKRGQLVLASEWDAFLTYSYLLSLGVREKPSRHNRKWRKLGILQYYS